MARKSIITISAILVVIAAIFVAYLYIEKNRNKETTVDLGNGWKSYSHENIGFTVKIPEDAEIEAGVAGNKNEQFIATFSKGDIEYIRAYDIGRDFSYCKSWEYNPRVSEYKSWCEKVEINGKIVIVLFSEAIYEHKNEIKLEFDDPQILGKRETHHISLKKEVTTHVEQRTSEHQNFTQEEVNDFVKEKTQLIKNLVLSVNNF